MYSNLSKDELEKVIWNKVKDVNKLVEQVKQAQERLVTLEKTASGLVAEFEKVKQLFEKENEKIEKLKKVDLKDKTEDQLRESELQIKKEIGGLLGLGKEIKNLSTKITQTVKDFDKTKNLGIESKAKYKASLDQYNVFSANKKAEKEKIEKELEILKRRIEPSIMDRYMQMREDKKFPILVPLVNNSCGGCAMALPNARLDLLKKDGVLECENCHRIIYINE